tara:strand:+ start:257 stop:637 length:381 start_codon:yes stop_codon:yes gene_type:complete
MSKISSLADGYKGGSPRVRSSNPKIQNSSKRIESGPSTSQVKPTEKVLENIKKPKIGRVNKINTLAGGYKGGSPRVRSENKFAFKDSPIKKIESGQLTNKIKKWHADGNLTADDIKYLITQLQTIV